MKITKLETTEQFEKIKKGDFVLVVWSDSAIRYDKSKKRLMGYHIAGNKRDRQMLFFKKAGYHYFNYDPANDGISTASEVCLVEYEV